MPSDASIKINYLTGDFTLSCGISAGQKLGNDITILDAHVHIHDCFPIVDFLNNSRRNFCQAASQDHPNSSFTAVLMLTESYGADWFSTLAELAAKKAGVNGQWSLTGTAEPQSMIARDSEGGELVIIAGRQIVTAERLEILALGITDLPPDGMPIRDVIHDVQTYGALCVLPWGFGKWTGKRGQIVANILAEDQGDNFFLGDNAGRLGLWPDPPEFRIARDSGIQILPGSDPLPYTSGAMSPGRFGFVLSEPLDQDRPFSSIRRSLVDESKQAKPYGRLEGLVPFATNQIRMQLRKLQ